MSRYYEVRKRISTEKSPLSDAEIIESLDREIEEYRDKIVRMKDKMRKRDLTEALMSEEMKALKKENEALKENVNGVAEDSLKVWKEKQELSKELDKLKKENEKLKADKKVIIINSDTYMECRMEENEHLRQTLDEILSVPSKKTEIRLHTGVDGTRMMEWRINGGTWIDD